MIAWANKFYPAMPINQSTEGGFSRPVRAGQER
jgi:hypothetical protein